MTILSTSGVLVVLAVVMLLWFIPRNMRRASAADTPEQTVVNPHSMTDDVLTSHSILFSEESAVPGSDPKKSNAASGNVPPLSEEETSAALSDLREASPVEPFTSPVPVLEQKPWLPERLHRLGTLRLTLLGIGALVALILIFSLILSLMGWLPWSAPTVSFVALAGIGGALYYLGQPKDGHEEPDAAYPETSGHNALPIEDEATEEEFAQDEAHELDAEEPEETSPSRSSKSSRWGSLRWNSGRASRKSTLEEESSEQGVPADHAPQIGADEFAAEPHELSEESVHEEYVEYAESYSAEDAQQHFSGTSHARRIPAQLHPKYPPQHAPEPVLYDEEQSAGHEASYEQAPSEHAFLASAEETPAQDVFAQPKNLHRAPAPQPEAQRHETRFVGSASAQGQTPRRPARIPGTHLRPLERTSELFDQEVQTTPTGQIPVTPAPGNTADAPQREGAVPRNGFLGSAPANTNQTQGHSAPSGMSNTSAQDAAFGPGMQDRADDSARSAPYRSAAHNPYLAQPQNTAQNPYAAPAQGYGTHQGKRVGQHQGMQQNQNTGQNRQAAQTGLGQQSLGEQQGYGQRSFAPQNQKHQTSTAQHASAQNLGPGFAPSRSVAEEKNLPPAGFTPQGAIRPMNQEPPRSQRPMGTTTGSGAQNSRFQQGPATGSVSVGGGSGFTNTSQFDVPVPLDLDDSEFEPLDIIPVVDEPGERSGSASNASASYKRGNMPGTGASFTGVSQKTWTPTQLPKPLSSLHQKKPNGSDGGPKNGEQK